MCVGVSGFGGCNGDSGGFFVCEVNGKWVFYGVVSFGERNCLIIYYIVFIRIMSYVDWINDKMGEFIGGY